MSTITCPHCSAPNPPNNSFCTNCGKSLQEPLENLETPTMAFNAQDVKKAVQENKTAEMPPASAPPAVETAPATIMMPRPGSMQLEFTNGERLGLKGALEYFVGRADPANDWNPAVDLAIREGHMYGVSRRHARFFFKEGGAFLEDIGSSNGTFVNDQEIKSGTPVSLNEGDKIMFGRLITKFYLG